MKRKSLKAKRKASNSTINSFESDRNPITVQRTGNDSRSFFYKAPFSIIIINIGKEQFVLKRAVNLDHINLCIEMKKEQPSELLIFNLS